VIVLAVVLFLPFSFSPLLRLFRGESKYYTGEEIATFLLFFFPFFSVLHQGIGKQRNSRPIWRWAPASSSLPFPLLSTGGVDWIT